MALSIYSTPKPVSLVGDPVIVEALTTSHLQQGNTTLVDLNIYGVSGRLFTKIKFPDTLTEVQFDYVETLTKETDIIAYEYWANYADFIQHAADRMGAVFEVRSKFTVKKVVYGTHINGLVRFESVEIKNVQITFEGSSINVEQHINGNLPIWNEGYMLGIRVYDENFQVIGELAERPPFNGIVKFNIAEIVEILPIPIFDLDTDILSYGDSCKPYKYEIYDKTGIPAVEDEHLWSDTLYAIFGKSTFIKKAKWNEELGSFYNEITVNKSFLTLQPDYKKISPFAPELLSFLVFDETISTVKLHITVNFTDGSSHETDKSTIGAIKGKVLQINISPDLLEIFEIDENKTVDNYNIVLRNQNNTDISQQRTYIIDYETYDFLRFFIARNNYGGGYDCMRSTGMVQNPAKIKKEFGNTTLPDDYTTKNRHETQVLAKRTLEFILNWGLLSKNGGDARDWKNYIQQIELSNDVFEYINSITVACSFITESYNLHDDNRTIYTHTSKYRRAFVDESYSNDDIPITGDYNDDFNNDYFN